MRIVGEWRAGQDGVKRPILWAKVHAVGGALQAGAFLIDCGADRTVFSAYLLADLHLPPISTPADVTVQGVGGGCEFVVVETIMELSRDDGQQARIKGQFAAFTDPAASEVSILGRDILDHFDVILGREYGPILLLAPPHRFHITPG